MNPHQLDKIDSDHDQHAVIDALFPVGTSPSDKQFILCLAREMGLSIVRRELHIVPRRQKVGDRYVVKAEPVIGVNGFLSIAHRTGQLAGMQTETCIKDIPQYVDGRFQNLPDLVATCTIWRKDSTKPFIASAAFSEFEVRGNDGKPSGLWGTKRLVMISKTAESMALRKAFNISGAYCPEELGVGYETESGEIISHDGDLSETTAASKTAGTAISAEPLPCQPEPCTDNYSDEGWPEAEPNPEDQVVVSDVVTKILSVLDEKNISYNVRHGVIQARSYHERKTLKELGFTWNAETKNWDYKFETEPF